MLYIHFSQESPHGFIHANLNGASEIVTVLLFISRNMRAQMTGTQSEDSNGFLCLDSFLSVTIWSVNGRRRLWYWNVTKHNHRRIAKFNNKVHVKHKPFLFLPPCLTCLSVEHNFILELLALLQGVVDAEYDAFTRLGAVQELTGTALLHDLCSGEACELAEAIWAVDDGKTLRHLSVGQDEVAVCMWSGREVQFIITCLATLYLNKSAMSFWCPCMQLKNNELGV